MPTPPAILKLRLVLDEGVFIGPGKADLLEGIRQTGSISAAGRGMRMSYRRAWMLVEALNAAFDPPLVQSAAGGKGGGGAHLTEAGDAVLAAYRRMEAACLAAAQADIALLQRARRR